MAKEINSTDVDRSEEQDTINEWQSFGWVFVSVQDVVDYIKLTFERDPAMQNYVELVSLERQYNDVPHPGDKPKLGRIIMGIGIAVLILGLIAASVSPDVSSTACIMVGIGMIILRLFFYFKKKNQWESGYNNWKTKRAEILEKAKFLS